MSFHDIILVLWHQIVVMIVNFNFISFANLMLNHTNKTNEKEKKKIQIHVIQYRQGHRNSLRQLLRARNT